MRPSSAAYLETESGEQMPEAVAVLTELDIEHRLIERTRRVDVGHTDVHFGDPATNLSSHSDSSFDVVVDLQREGADVEVTGRHAAMVHPRPARESSAPPTISRR